MLVYGESINHHLLTKMVKPIHMELNPVLLHGMVVEVVVRPYPSVYSVLWLGW